MKILKIIKYIFASIGLCMLIGAFLLYKNTSDFVSTATVAIGEVVDFETHRSDNSTMYSPVVVFQAKDNSTHKFVSSVSSNPAGYEIGEKVEVLYRVQFPQEAQINRVFSLYFAPIFLSFMGGVFFLIGGVLILVEIQKNKLKDYLLSNGRRVEAKFQTVDFNNSLTVNGRHPYVIITQWINPTNNEMHEFKSDNIWFDPKEFIKTENITVFIDPKNFKKYWMDIRFLPKES